MFEFNQIDSIKKLTYPKIKEAISSCSKYELLSLLDNKSIKVGDVAASLLYHVPNSFEFLIEAVLSNAIKTKLGRVRALNNLAIGGKSVNRAHEAYLHLIGDRSTGVVSCALFGLVFLQNISHLDAIKKARSKCKIGDARIEMYDRAIRALAECDPKIYSPYFWDRENVWELRREA